MRKAKPRRPQYLLIGFAGVMFAFSLEHSSFESSTLCTSYLNYPLAIVIVNYLNESKAYLLSYIVPPPHHHHHKWPNSTGDLRERNWETHENNDSGGDPGSPRRLGRLSPSLSEVTKSANSFLTCFCSSLRISFKVRHITEFVGLLRGGFPCTARLASNVQSSCLILPNTGLRGVSYHAYFRVTGLKGTRTLKYVTECIE